MSLGPHLRRWLLLYLGAVHCHAHVARGGEPFQAFLEGLRQRHFFDTALDYLEQSKSNPLVSEADRERIPFEAGRTLIEQAATIRDLAVRNQRLDEAQQRFEAFIKERPEHPVAAEAAVQLGMVLVERGRVALASANNPRQVANRTQLIGQARSRFEQAQKVFAEAEPRFQEEFQKYPQIIDPKQRDQVRARDRARVNWIHAQMLTAMVQRDLAKTLDANSAEYKSALTAAAGKYEEIYKRHPNMLAALYARMYQAECLLELGSSNDALTYIDEVLAHAGSQAPLRGLVNKTLPIAMRGWNQAQQYDRTIEAGTRWDNESTGLERQSPEGLSIIWLTAQAYRQRSSGNGKPADADLRHAARLAALVARAPGEFQDDARALVADLRKTSADAEAKTFADALAQGKSAIDDLSATLQELKQAGTDRAKQAELEQAKSAAIERAKQSFDSAVALRTPDVKPDEINELRYYLAYLNYLQGRYYDAAVLAEFIARKYPATGTARQSARIALVSYLLAFNAQPEASRQFEVERLAALAEYIGQTWADQPEATEAWMLLGDVAIRQGDMNRANEYLARIPANSPQRGEADLKQGQAIWARYLEMQRTADPAASAQLDEMLNTARTMLEQGVARSRHGEQVPGFNVLAAELTLAQMYNSRLEYDKALALLTRPQTGPLALIAAENPVALRGNYAGEALTAALRSYVGARRIDQAEQVMNQLEKQYANSPDGDAQLTAIYVRLGRELETELKQLQAASKHDHLQQVLDGFQLFLDRIAARDVANAATLLWVGETYYRLATGIQDDPAKSAQAKGYFERSKNAYEKLLQQSESDPKLQQGAAAIRVRLARAYRGARDYRAALDQLTKILSESPNVLECQIEAAHTYADWGRVDPQWYQQAINGTGDDGRIWGFNGIRRRLQNVERFKSQYEEARFQVANCSYQLALSKQGDERINSLNTVERMIQSFARLDPELGGSQWREKYDRLLKDVQRAAGRQPQGLPNITSATTARSRTTPAT